MKNVVPKLQNLILLVTRGDVHLEYSIVPTVPVFPQNPWIIILLRKTMPQNLMTSSTVNFVIKGFQDYTLYVKIEAPNMVFVSRQQMLIGTISSTKLTMRSWEELRPCQFFLVYYELECARHKVFNYAGENLNTKIVDKKRDQFSNKLKCAAKANLVFRFILWTKEDGGLRYFYAQENNPLLDLSKPVHTPGTTWQN